MHFFFFSLIEFWFQTAQDGGEESSRLTNDTTKLTPTKSEPDVDG